MQDAQGWVAAPCCARCTCLRRLSLDLISPAACCGHDPHAATTQPLSACSSPARHPAPSVPSLLPCPSRNSSAPRCAAAWCLSARLWRTSSARCRPPRTGAPSSWRVRRAVVPREPSAVLHYAALRCAVLCCAALRCAVWVKQQGILAAPPSPAHAVLCGWRLSGPGPFWRACLPPTSCARLCPLPRMPPMPLRAGSGHESTLAEMVPAERVIRERRRQARRQMLPGGGQGAGAADADVLDV